MIDGNVLVEAAQAAEPKVKAARAKSSVPRVTKGAVMYPAMKVLREKKYSWQEVADWFVERGVTTSKVNCSTIYARYKKREAA